MESSENELADPRTEAVQIPVDSPEHEDAPSGTDENPVHIIAYQYGDEDPTATAQEKVAAKETAAAES